jgi:hypothetical protein
MPWDALRTELGPGPGHLNATTVEGPLWHVTRADAAFAFSAHPAFLDDLRNQQAANGSELAALLIGGAPAYGPILGRRRIVPDNRILGNYDPLTGLGDPRTPLGIAAPRFGAPPELIPLWQHHDSYRNLAAVLQDPAVLTRATAFADQVAPNAAVADFINLHAFYLAAEQAGVAPGAVVAARNLGLTTANHLGVGRVDLHTAAWQTNNPNFAATIVQNVNNLKYATRDALLAHSFKHRLRNGPQYQGDQASMDTLVQQYLADARTKIGAGDNPAVFSSLAQLGGSRTYYFGTLSVYASMVAVNEAGEAWISTFYNSQSRY